MNIYIFLKNIRKVIMRLTQIFKHYHSCLETVLFFNFFFIEWMTCLPKRITRFFWQCVIRRSSRKSSFVLNLPMVFNGLDVMNNFVEQEKKTGPV